MASTDPYLSYFAYPPPGWGVQGVAWRPTAPRSSGSVKPICFPSRSPSSSRAWPAARAARSCPTSPTSSNSSACSAAPRRRTPRSRKRVCALQKAFADAGGNDRNAGVFAAELAADVPRAAFLPPGGGVSLAHWLSALPSLGFLPTARNAEVPALHPGTLHRRIAERLRKFTDAELRHWLRHGTAPEAAPAERIAEEIAHKPPGLGDLFRDLLSRRPRLGAVEPLVDRFVSALALPQRRLTPPRLPVGGYADVATRGKPEQLLPSQFALEPDEFVRRFAENGVRCTSAGKTPPRPAATGSSSCSTRACGRGARCGSP